MKEQGMKLQPLGYKHRIFYDLRKWPTFWQNVQDFIEANTLTKFHEYQTENVVPRVRQGFSKICPSDLVYDPPWRIYVFDWDFIKTKLLTKFYDYRTENVASRAYTSFV